LILPALLVFVGAAILRTVNELASITTLYAPELRRRARLGLVLGGVSLIAGVIAHSQGWSTVVALSATASIFLCVTALRLDREVCRVWRAARHPGGVFTQPTGRVVSLQASAQANRSG
jgi:hypothetical protein